MIKVEFLGEEIEFKDKQELKEHLTRAMKYFDKDSSYYARLRMIQLEYDL